LQSLQFLGTLFGENFFLFTFLLGLSDFSFKLKVLLKLLLALFFFLL